MSTTKVAAVADFGGTNIRAALIDGSGLVLARSDWPVDHTTTAYENVRRIVSNLWKLVGQCGLTRDAITGLGVSVGAIVDAAEGYVYDFINCGWRDLPMAAWLRDLSGRPALIEMDAHAAALGEAWRGAAQGVRHFILLIVGTGIGAGLIFDGRLYRGFGGLAGEFGHMSIQMEGPLCGCGRYGCLEALASGIAIASAARAAVLRSVPTALAAKAPETLSAADVVAAARARDDCATRIIDGASRSLAIGISNLMHGLSPEVVLLGGGVILNGSDIMLPRVRAEVEHQLNYGIRGGMRRIELAMLGDAAGLFGVAHRVFEEYG